MAAIVVPNLEHALQALLAQIPAGRVATCGGLADALGNKIAARWVGHYLLHHRHDNACPCHRVVRAGGELGGYIGGVESKERLLKEESVELAAGRIDLERFQVQTLASDRPLERLARLQDELATRVSLSPTADAPEVVAGIDVSYAAETATAAYCLVERSTGKLLWSHVVHRPAEFPYISSYLTFRELPSYLVLLEEVRAAGRLTPVVLVDGTGRLHPRKAGIASHLGVVADLPTVGVTKKLLCGKVELRGIAIGESRPVVQDNETIGVAIRTGKSLRPIFVSPGHRMDLATSEAIVRGVLRGRRLPEPLYHADRLSRLESRRRAVKL